MARTLVAGVDTSTQSCKVRVTDAETGELVRFGQAKHPNGTSVDPSYWWSAFQEAAEQAGGLDDVSALAVGGQQHGMVILDNQGQCDPREPRCGVRKIKFCPKSCRADAQQLFSACNPAAKKVSWRKTDRKGRTTI